MCVTQQRTIVCTFLCRQQQDATDEGNGSSNNEDKNENKQYTKETTKTRMKRKSEEKQRQNSLKAFNIGCYITLYHRAVYGKRRRSIIRMQ